jgi:hypothetical protein
MSSGSRDCGGELKLANERVGGGRDVLFDRGHLLSKILKVGDFQQCLEIACPVLRPDREHIAERMLRENWRPQRRLREDDSKAGKIGFGRHFAVNLQDGLTLLLFAVVGLECAPYRAGRAVRVHDDRLNEHLRVNRKVSVPERVSELVLAARHQRAPDDLSCQQKLDSFGEARLPLAVRPPHGSK